MFNLSARIAQHPINDEPYLRHLRTAEAFHAVNEARENAYDALKKVDQALADQERAEKAVLDALAEHEAAYNGWKAEEAKIELMQSMEDL